MILALQTKGEEQKQEMEILEQKWDQMKKNQVN